MKHPEAPDISAYPALSAEKTAARDGAHALRLTWKPGDSPQECPADPPCPETRCRHTRPLIHADREMTAAGWRMVSGKASQDGPESRLYRPVEKNPATEPSPPAPAQAVNPAQNPAQTSLWPAPPEE